MHIIFGWHTQAHIIGHAATVNLSSVSPAEVSGYRARLGLQVPAAPHGVSSCHRWTHEGQSLGKKSEKSVERKEQPEDLYTGCFWNSLSSPHIRGIGRIWFVGLPADPLGVPPPVGPRLVPPGSASHRFSVRFLQFALTLFRLWLFFFPRARLSVKFPQEAETMFCRNQTARATVARGSALEMEIRRGKFRKSVFQDTSQVHWLSASYHYIHTHKHAHAGPLGNFQTRTRRHSLWGFVCLQLWLISLLLQTNLFGTRSISLRRHRSVRFALCAVLITLH